MKKPAIINQLHYMCCHFYYILKVFSIVLSPQLLDHCPASDFYLEIHSITYTLLSSMFYLLLHSESLEGHRLFYSTLQSSLHYRGYWPTDYQVSCNTIKRNKREPLPNVLIYQLQFNEKYDATRPVKQFISNMMKHDKDVGMKMDHAFTTTARNQMQCQILRQTTLEEYIFHGIISHHTILPEKFHATVQSIASPTQAVDRSECPRATSLWWRPFEKNRMGSMHSE